MKKINSCVTVIVLFASLQTLGMGKQTENEVKKLTSMASETSTNAWLDRDFGLNKKRPKRKKRKMMMQLLETNIDSELKQKENDSEVSTFHQKPTTKERIKAKEHFFSSLINILWTSHEEIKELKSQKQRCNHYSEIYIYRDLMQEISRIENKTSQIFLDLCDSTHYPELQPIYKRFLSYGLTGVHAECDKLSDCSSNNSNDDEIELFDWEIVTIFTQKIHALLYSK